MDCSMPGFPVHHQLLELAQTHAHWVGDAIQPSHPLSSPSPPAFNLSQQQGLFQWAISSHQVWLETSYWQFDISCCKNIYTMEISKCYITGLFFFPLKEPVVKHLPAHHCVYSVTLSHLDPFQQHSNILKSFLPFLRKPQPPHLPPATILSLFFFTVKLLQRIDYISWLHLVILRSSFNIIKPVFATTTPLKQLLLSSMISMNPKFYEQFSLTFFDLVAVFNSVDICLLEILLSLGFDGPGYWLSSNLSNFSFSVPFSSSSHFPSRDAGVFQGLVLGPRLYSLPRQFHLFSWLYTLSIHQWLLDFYI